ncbi:MAG: hypothetical protein HRT61_00650 [Ekhidna sp.]|nr:hypothetical protein [Ekhidna sp.]
MPEKQLSCLVHCKDKPLRTNVQEKKTQLVVPVATILDNKMGIFATKETVVEAHEYALSLVTQDMQSPMSIAIGVYHNTLMQALTGDAYTKVVEVLDNAAS